MAAPLRSVPTGDDATRPLREQLLEEHPIIADFRIEDSRRWIDVAEPWQLEDLTAVLDTDGPPYHWLDRPRGGDKSGGGALAAMVIMMDQVPPMSEVSAVASDKDQAAKLVKRVRSFVARAPADSLLREWDPKLTLATAPNGSRLESIASDASSAWGALTPLILVDELGNWPNTPSAKEMWTTIWTSVVKFPGCRLIVMSTKGRRNHWTRRHKFLEKAEASAKWRVSTVTGTIPWERDDELEEQRAFLFSDDDYSRLHENTETDDSGIWERLRAERSMSSGADVGSVRGLRW